MLEINERMQGDVHILDIDGKCNFENAHLLQNAFNSIIEKGGLKIVVNLERLVFLDSSGLGSLIKAYQDLSKRGGRIGIVNVDDKIRKIFSITKTDKFVMLCDDIEDGIAKVGG